MLKRSIAIFLFVIANTIWLAHAIVPHHHHNFQAILHDNHCAENRSDHSHFPATDFNEHHHGNFADCSLKQLAIVPPGNLKSFRTFSDYSDSGADLENYQIVLPFIYSNFTVAIKAFAVVYGSTSIPLYTALIGHSLGLRAPPAV